MEEEGRQVKRSRKDPMTGATRDFDEWEEKDRSHMNLESVREIFALRETLVEMEGHDSAKHYGKIHEEELRLMRARVPDDHRLPTIAELELADKEIHVALYELVNHRGKSFMAAVDAVLTDFRPWKWLDSKPCIKHTVAHSAPASSQGSEGFSRRQLAKGAGKGTKGNYGNATSGKGFKEGGEASSKGVPREFTGKLTSRPGSKGKSKGDLICFDRHLGAAPHGQCSYGDSCRKIHNLCPNWRKDGGGWCLKDHHMAACDSQ